MAISYPGISYLRGYDKGDPFGKFVEGYGFGKGLKDEAEAPDAFMAWLDSLGGNADPSIAKAFSNPLTRNIALSEAEAAINRREQANDPLRQLQIAKVRRDMTAGPEPTAAMREFAMAQSNPKFAEFIGSNNQYAKAPAAVQQYLFYRDQEKEAGREPLSYIDFQNALDGGGAGGEFGLTPVWGVDAEGNPVLGQMNKAGGVQIAPMPDGVTFGKEPIRLDAGTHFVLLDPVTRAQIGTVPKDNYGEGYERAKGGAEGKFAGEEPERRGKAAAALAALETKQQLVTDTIDKALQNAGFWTTGVVGGLSNPVWGTPAYDLARTLDTIKANIGFDELQTMRDNSPTGGALGQVTERELAFLQSTIANIEQAQSEQQLRENLKTLRQFITTRRDQRRDAFNSQFGGGNASSADNDPLGIR